MRLHRQVVSLVAALGLAVPGLLTATSPGAGAAPGDPIAKVQESSSGSFTATSNTINLAAAPKEGSLLVLLFRNGTDANDITSVTGGGVTWVKAQSWAPASQPLADIWYGLNAHLGGTAITYTLAGGPAVTQLYSANVSEWSGVAAVDPPANRPQNTGTGTTATTASITPAVPNELFIGLISTAGGFVGSTPGGGFSAFTNGLAGNGGAGFLIATDPAAHAMSWTTTSAAFTGGLVAFEPTQAPAAAPAAPTIVVTPRFTG